MENDRMPEPELDFCTLRDGDDEIHLECRFKDGQKFAAVIIEAGFEKLAAYIAHFLNTRPALPAEGDAEVERLREAADYLLRGLKDVLAGKAVRDLDEREVAYNAACQTPLISVRPSIKTAVDKLTSTPVGIEDLQRRAATDGDRVEGE